MRSKDKELLDRIKAYVEDYCDANGCGPSTREVAKHFGIASTTAYNYMVRLGDDGRIARGRDGFESNALFNNRAGRSVAILGAVPCGPLEEMEEYIEGYVRLPESFVGKGKFFILNASGNSMIGAGINDGDMVLIRQQNTANIGDIIVALVENEVTLKRLGYDEAEHRYYLRPENKRMKDMYVDSLEIQGVAVKVIKDL